MCWRALARPPLPEQRTASEPVGASRSLACLRIVPLTTHKHGGEARERARRRAPAGTLGQCSSTSVRQASARMTSLRKSRTCRQRGTVMTHTVTTIGDQSPARMHSKRAEQETVCAA